MMTCEVDAWRRSACDGKIPYASRREARLAIKRAGLPLDCYRCTFCFNWHTGNKHGKRGTKQARTRTAMQ